ncbi:hypothetical protein JVX90_13680 [Gordonia sp. PDNC005]|uniref:hypothetical protein n=1 Tax=Gordonia sp. PDNC005 TaxID=2811424 RepID=UPI00196618A6|nr:hypothetical protein [Gordonia sp. PDNC005]QRY61462.1 hypothetical protein JVX90_13680 [Gordonia sp. PDNC005]
MTSEKTLTITTRHGPETFLGDQFELVEDALGFQAVIDTKRDDIVWQESADARIISVTGSDQSTM